jgi:hypothetical protein
LQSALSATALPSSFFSFIFVKGSTKVATKIRPTTGWCQEFAEDVPEREIGQEVESKRLDRWCQNLLIRSAGSTAAHLVDQKRVAEF